MNDEIADVTRLRGPDLLEGRRSRLEPIASGNEEYLRHIEIRELGPRWRHGGETATLEGVRERLAAGALAQFIVVERVKSEPVGIVSCLNPDFANGVASVAAARFHKDHGGLAFGEGLAMFVEYVFFCWSFRKVYFEVAEYNRPQFSTTLARLCELEGSLRDRLYLGGQFWDLGFYALERERWMGSVERHLAVTIRDQTESETGVRH